MKIPSRLIIEALKKTILVGASVHLIILTIFAWKTTSPDMLNIYNILDFDLIKPEMGRGAENFIYSWMFISAIFAFMLIVSHKQKSK